jgi:[acyl-carrier-protein] S-malonyltransferase
MGPPPTASSAHIPCQHAPCEQRARAPLLYNRWYNELLLSRPLGAEGCRVTHEAHPDTETDPVAIVFPGQGSQAPGMGKLVFEHSEAARRTFEEASDTTGVDLAAVCFETDAEALADTANTQPAVVTTSVAILRAMREKLGDVGARVRPRVFGGHSLGLFSAAVAAEAISFRDSLLVIMERARLMGSFNEERPVGMASILGLDRDTVSQICEDATRSAQDRVDVANLNEETQTVISGDVTALERAMELARELQGKAIRLKIKVSSHTPLHAEQADEFAEVIRDVPFEDPSRPIVSNITSEFLINAEAVRREFEAQLRSPVHWADNVQRMTREGVDTFIEVGPGHALSRMVRRMSDRTAVSLDDAREAPIPISVLPALTADRPPSA